MVFPYEPYVPFDPVNAGIFPTATDPESGSRGDGETYRVVHEPDRSIEFQGTRHDSVGFVGRAWWRSLFQYGPDEDRRRRSYAVALTLERWNGREWERDGALTERLIRINDGS